MNRSEIFRFDSISCTLFKDRQYPRLDAGTWHAFAIRRWVPESAVGATQRICRVEIHADKYDRFVWRHIREVVINLLVRRHQRKVWAYEALFLFTEIFDG